MCERETKAPLSHASLWHTQVRNSSFFHSGAPDRVYAQSLASTTGGEAVKIQLYITSSRAHYTAIHKKAHRDFTPWAGKGKSGSERGFLLPGSAEAAQRERIAYRKKCLPGLSRSTYQLTNRAKRRTYWKRNRGTGNDRRGHNHHFSSPRATAQNTEKGQLSWF